MAKNIRNMEELEKALQPILVNMLHETLNYFLND